MIVHDSWWYLMIKEKRKWLQVLNTIFLNGNGHGDLYGKKWRMDDLRIVHDS